MKKVLFPILAVVLALSLALPMAAVAGANGLVEYIETIYLADTHEIGTDDGTTIFTVELVDDALNKANLTEFCQMPDDARYDTVAALACSPDGGTLYVIDRDTTWLAKYDIASSTWTQVAATGLNTCVQLVCSLDGTLYAASNATDSLYTVDTSTAATTLLGVIKEGGTTTVNVSGADIVFGVDASDPPNEILYLWTDGGKRGLYTLSLPPSGGVVSATWLGSDVPTFTGLAIRAGGAGDLLGSNTTNDRIEQLSRSNGSIVKSYDMYMGGSPYAYEWGDMTVGELAVEVGEPSITIDKETDFEGRATIGDTIEYTFEVYNDGDVDLTDVTLSDTLIDPGDISGPTGDDGDGILNPGETWYYTGDSVSVETAKRVNLWAGKDTDVGYVEIWNDGDCVHVIYQIDDGMPWEITEVHLYVGSNEPPTNAPGQFPYDIGDADSVTETTVEFCIALEDIDSYSMKVNKKGKTVGPMTADGNPGKIGEEPIVPGDTIYVAAHSVVMDISCYQTGILYGIERYTGKVYEVDVLSGASSLEFTITPPPALGSAKPNGLAYDPAGDGRWYFCDYQPTTTLYFWDGISQQVAGDLTVDDVGAPVGDIADADFYDGKYYFVTGPPSSDLLYEVTFDANGLMTGPPVFIASISGGTHDYTFNGDIAIKDGVIYGWGKCGTHNKYEFFSVNIDGTGFAYVTPTYQTSLQLAFGSDGTLYGHRSGGTGEFFEVGTGIADFGDVTSIGWNVQGQLYTDCASGEICIPTTETAWGGWGDGILNRVEFPDKNWSNYLWFDLMDCDD